MSKGRPMLSVVTVAPAEMLRIVAPIGNDLVAMHDRMRARRVPFNRNEIPVYLAVEARGELERLTELLRPVTPDEIYCWVSFLCRQAALRDQPTEPELLARAIAGLGATCGVLARGCWTQAAAIEYLRKQIMFPLPATLYGHLRPAHDAMVSNAAICRRIVEASERSPPPPVDDTRPCPEEVARVEATLAELGRPRRGQVEPSGHIADTPPPRAELSEPALLASIHAEIRRASPGQRGALEERAARLEQRLAREAPAE